MHAAVERTHDRLPSHGKREHRGAVREPHRAHVVVGVEVQLLFTVIGSEGDLAIIDDGTTVGLRIRPAERSGRCK